MVIERVGECIYITEGKTKTLILPNSKKILSTKSPTAAETESRYDR